jgi:hypothetical protein
MRIFRRKVKPEDTPGAEAPKCPQCGSTSLKRVLDTHPVHLTGKLAGRRVDVYRVEMDKCRDCGALTPTAEGKAKIERCTKTGIEFFVKHLAELQSNPPTARAKERARQRSRQDVGGNLRRQGRKAATRNPGPKASRR